MLITKRKHSGFTLLEIMLVFLLIAVASVGVVMTMPAQVASQEDIQWQAERFRSLLLFAEDEALMSGLELGLFFTESSYQFVAYDYQSKGWQVLDNKQLSKKIVLPDTVAVQYNLAGSIWQELDTEEKDSFIDDDDLVHIEGYEKQEAISPQIYLMSSGEVTPFSVTFSAVQNGQSSPSVTFSVAMTGSVTSVE